MEKHETKKLLGMFQVHYPFSYKEWDDAMWNIAIESWHYNLESLDVRLVFNVASRYIAMDKSGFPPTMAHLLEAYHKAITPSAFVTGEEAWASVKKAIKQFGYYRENEAMNVLSAKTVKAIRSIGWSYMCQADDKTFDFMRKRFIESYEDASKDEIASVIAPKTQARIEEFGEKMKAIPLPEIYRKALEISEGSDEVQEM